MRTPKSHSLFYKSPFRSSKNVSVSFSSDQSPHGVHSRLNITKPFAVNRNNDSDNIANDLSEHFQRKQWHSFHTPHRINNKTPLLQQGPPPPYNAHHNTSGVFHSKRQPQSYCEEGEELGHQRSASALVGCRITRSSCAAAAAAAGSGAASNQSIVEGGEAFSRFGKRKVVDEGVFKRHLIEFDQLSRNITVSFNRNSKVRSSVR